MGVPMAGNNAVADFTGLNTDAEVPGAECQRSAGAALKDDQLDIAVARGQLAFEQTGDTDEVGDKGVHRIGIDIFGIANLLDHGLVHHHCIHLYRCYKRS